MKGILFVLILLIFGGFQFSFQNQDAVQSKATKTDFKTKYHIILVIDGPRYSETFGDTACTLIPFMGKELIKEGTLFTNFMNNGVTHTTPGHVALTSGVYQSISNSGKQLPKNPSIFQYYLKTKNVDKGDAWIIASKGKLEVLGNTKSKRWWNMYTPMTFCGLNGNGADYVGDSETWKKVKEIFNSKPPHLSLINLLSPDAFGHQGDWENYKKSILQCDAYVNELWKIIQSHPEMKNQTALYVTNDHGRHLDGHKDGFISHGDKCMGCKHISLLALGPDFKANEIIATPAEMIDIPATISHMMKFEMPTGKGRVLCELFVD